VDECRERGMTFSAPLKVTVRLVVWEVDPENRDPHDLEHQGAGGLLR
jgi:DNA-directed RNA polymerase subunit beta